MPPSAARTKLGLIRANQIAITATPAISTEKDHPVLPVGSQSSDVTVPCRATGVRDTVVPANTRPNAHDRYLLSHPTAREHC